MMKELIGMSLLALGFCSMGQVSEDFSDGDFATNPTWTGDDMEFRVENGELQLFDDKTDDSHLMTTSTVLVGGVWEFLFRWEGFSSTGLSSSNEVFFYLAADQNLAPEANPIAGYLVRIGNTSDEISFYRQDSNLSSLVELIDGNTSGFGGVTKSSNGAVRIRVTREEMGIWKLEADISGGTSYVEVGTTVDLTYSSSAYAGVFIDYSSGNAAGYFFDDIQISSNVGPDEDAPAIDTVLAVSETHVDIQFNELISESSAKDIANYQVEGISVIDAELDESNHRLVHLSVNSITPGQLLDLMVRGIEDLAGNIMEETTHAFFLPRQPGFNELIISEIMFDPDPAIGLPNREYIELHNRTSHYLWTKELTLSDATSQLELPQFIIEPGAFYSLTSTSGASEFSGNVIGVPGFPSLNNTGEQLTISNGDQIIFSVTYDPDWHDSGKIDGGYSLEMKDLENPCLENGNNWSSSIDVGGGTPGEENSISERIPDSFGPEISRVIPLSPDSIKVEFNERINIENVSFISATIDPFIAVNQVALYDLSSILIVLNESLEFNIPYSLKIENLTDCSGNEIQDGNANFVRPVAAEVGDIKLSEILFNPRTNGVDFVEIYNDSDKYISLKGWKLGSHNDEGNVDDVDWITPDEYIIYPKTYLALTTDSEILLTNYPKGQFENFFQMTSLPSYPNDEGTVVLVDHLDQVHEAFTYNEGFHFSLLESVDGVSLERISFEKPTNQKDNWRSASSDVGFATPGYVNSHSFESDVPLGNIEAVPQVFIPGNLGQGNDFTTINYHFDQPGLFANVNIYDARGRIVRNLAQGILLSKSGFLRWDGDANDGDIARMGYHLIIFEIYDGGGNTQILKETVVVGRDF